MTIHPQTCLTVSCNACPNLLVDDEYEQPIHLDSPASARSTATEYSWTVLPNDVYLCNTRDDAHKKHLEALKQPAPVPPVPGQLDTDGREVGP
ncbi:hypothetical protein ABZ829_27660 [Streptomyces xanthochromogenes]|uniref:hypothetical protein n=1 Tax=Streptomyces xanthochromogenes TaxID=67384 RepID=UPI0034309764